MIAMTLACLLAQDKDPDVATVSLDVKSASLGLILEMVSKRSGIPIELDADAKKDLDLKEVITIKLENLVVTGALKLILFPSGFEAKVVGKKKVLIVRAPGK
jgi:hypothetical protein